MDTLKEHLKKASKAQKAKYTKEDFSKWGSAGVKKKLAGMSKEEISEYFRNIRNSKK